MKKLKYINSYRLFESSNEDLKKVYLDKLGTDEEELQYIVVDLIDMGYELKVSLEFENSTGSTHSKKWAGENTPILKLSLGTPNKMVTNDAKYKDIKLIGTITKVTNHIINQFSDKVDVTYSFGFGNIASTIYYELKFPKENNTERLGVSKTELDELLNKVLTMKANELIHPNNNYVYSLSNEQKGKSSIIFNIRNRESLKDKLFKKLEDSKDDYLENYEDVKVIARSILYYLIDVLNVKLKTNLTFQPKSEGSLSGHIRYKNGDEYYDILEVTDDYDTISYNKIIKRGLFKREKIEIEVVNYFNLTFKII